MNQTIDWPGIRANAVHVGVREAARQAAADLPPIEQDRFVFRVLKRSMRQGWITRKIDVQAAKTAKREAVAQSNAKPLSAPVLMSSDAAAASLAEMGKETRFNLVKAAGKAALTFAERSGEAVIESAQALRHVTAAAAVLHSWEEGKTAGLVLNLGLQVNTQK